MTPRPDLVLGLAGAFVVVALLLVLAARASLTLSSNVQAKADPSGAWALAFGLGCGPIALSAIAARGVQPFLTCHVFGKQLVRLPLSRWLRARKRAGASAESEVKPEPRPKLSRFERSVGGWLGSLDPFDALLEWWQNDRVFAVNSLKVEVHYSFRDVALTGRILAALYLLSALLPEVCELHQTPSWESEDRVALGVDGWFQIWPGRLLIDIVRFMLKQRSEARRSAALAKRAAESS